MLASRIYDVAIIGGGASGLMCAAYLHQLRGDADILVIEKNHQIGNKIFVTGNGRCNLTNTGLSAADYYTDDYAALKDILDRYTPGVAAELFEHCLGLHLGKKGELVYPFSFKSASVVEAFRMALQGVEVVLNCEVTGTSRDKETFAVEAGEVTYRARNVVFACGGRAAPRTGSDGKVYRLLLHYASRNDFESVLPGLVQLKTLEEDTHSLSGTRVNVSLKLYSGSELLGTDRGEMLFTDYGISGICILNLSSIYNRAVRDGRKNISISADLLPDEDALELITAFSRALPERGPRDLLKAFFTPELADVIIGRICDKDARNGAKIISPLDFDEKMIRKIAETIKDFRMSITGSQGFETAQVTTGGIKLSRLDRDCRLADGVYVIGETVNVDGPCGGYNLHWAWASGMAAAEKIAQTLDVAPDVAAARKGVTKDDI